MKKQFLRVKQIADQTFLRAEKSDALTEDLVLADKKVDLIKSCCQSTQKKISACQIDFGSETSIEKRLKKIPQVLLGNSMLESTNGFPKNSLLSDTLQKCGVIQSKLGSDLLEYYTEVEKLILKPVSSILEIDIHNINKLRKQLSKLVLDMDSARTRYQTAEKHSLQASSTNSLNAVGKVDNLKDELEDASQKVEQCRDTLATEMFTLLGKEPYIAHLFVHLHQLQASYHRRALAALEESLPSLENLISNFPQQPVYGCSLKDHLRVTDREIALVIENCIAFLSEYGLTEEGLLRIAGGASRLKKIKSAFDAGVELEMEEYIRDPHAVAGALKSYLRELPEPLLTHALYDEWMEAAKSADSDNKLQALWQVLHKLPEENFRNLRHVITFLVKLKENMNVNKMSAQNIAIVMAPNLIWSPTEDNSTLGMNMSIANLHTSIVDALILYADWFFPDGETSANSEIARLLPNIETPKPTEMIPASDTEENINSLQVNGSEFSPPSPRSPLRMKKSIAPLPPPSSKSLEEGSGELIDFFADCGDPFPKNIDSSDPNEISEEVKETVEIRKKSDESVSLSGGDSAVFRAEKPVIPDKPSYSSYSLDRKSSRQSTNSARASRIGGGNNRTSDPMTRSHIERPTVPPPERPVKAASKFLSSENLCAATELTKTKKDSLEDIEIVSTSTTSTVASFTAPIPAAREGSSISGLQHSRSTSKVNRFDFLVIQKEEKPPERPPRTVVAPEASATVAVPEIRPELPVKSVVQDARPLPPSPRPVEVEKIKPPRPQPPVPAKPKLNLQTENTNL